jgi:hypothetical protein
VRIPRRGEVKEPTYYIQFSSPVEESGRWHTIARVEGKQLADEIVRLVEGSYGRTTVMYHYLGRAVSRSAMKRDGVLQHADWELGIGHFREYGEMVRAKAERNLAAVST